MKLKFSRILAAAGALALAAVATTAQARDVYWSVGIHAAPGVAVGLGNVPVYAPQPVYVAPQPVYVAPRPVYVTAPPVYYVQPAPVYYGYGHKHKHKHHHSGRGWHKGHGHRH